MSSFSQESGELRIGRTISVVAVTSSRRSCRHRSAVGSHLVSDSDIDVRRSSGYVDPRGTSIFGVRRNSDRAEDIIPPRRGQSNASAGNTLRLPAWPHTATPPIHRTGSIHPASPLPLLSCYASPSRQSCDAVATALVARSGLWRPTTTSIAAPFAQQNVASIPVNPETNGAATSTTPTSASTAKCTA